MSRSESWAAAILFGGVGIITTALGILYGKKFWNWGLLVGLAIIFLSIIALIMIWWNRLPTSEPFSVTDQKNINHGVNNGIIGDVSGNVSFEKQPGFLLPGTAEHIVSICPRDKPVTVVSVDPQAITVPMREEVVRAFAAAGIIAETGHASQYSNPAGQPIFLHKGDAYTRVVIFPYRP